MGRTPELTFTFSPMEGGKTRQIIIERWEAEESDISTLLAKPSTDKKGGEQIITRFGNMTSDVDVIFTKDDDVVQAVLAGIGRRAAQLEGGELAHELARLEDKAIHQTLTHLGKLAAQEHPWRLYVDEAQFISPSQVDDLRTLVDEHGVGVEAFGLRTDFRGDFFPGSDALMRKADHIREIKKACKIKGCSHNAIYNSRIVDGLIITEGEQVAIDGIDARYVPLCSTHYKEGQNTTLDYPKS